MAPIDQPAIHEHIRRIASGSPGAPALRHGSATLPYGEFDGRANRLANRILDRVPPGSVVAILADRSFNHIIAALAVLKAGSAYVWLDPGDPIDRIRALVGTGTIALLLTDNRHGERVGSVSAPTMVIGAEHAVGAQRPALPAPMADDLAYVAFTSGTTGRPKGACITHANLSALINWHVRAFAVTPDDRASHLAGLSFDASAWEIWPYLAVGASVTLADDTTRTSPAALADWLVAEQVTIGFVPTALAGAMITGPWPEASRLRAMLVGGEALRIRPRPGLPFAVFNNYGVAECAVVATSGQLAPDDPDPAPPSIGRPIEDVTIHILDADRRPVRAGAEGEIWIGGATVGRGYLGEPDLTAAAFVDDAVRGGGRMYRTGDRGRLLATGEIRHLGRLDTQCKIRGVRIETEEVASQLRRHGGVADAVVAVEEDATLGTQLVAYVVPAVAADAPAADELRAFLARTLPLTYLPTRFAAVPAFPLTANGKVDRAALAASAATATNQARQMTEPANPVEERLLAIVRNVLNRADVSTDDDFFLLGGHSLLATQVVLRARDAFGIDLVLRDLFEAPTIQLLGGIVAERLAARIAGMSPAEIDAMLAGAGA